MLNAFDHNIMHYGMLFAETILEQYAEFWSKVVYGPEAQIS